MPYTLPTATQFKTKFPRFTSIGDPRVTSAITEASSEVDDTWREADYQNGIMYLAAHLLIVDNALYSPPSEGESGGSDPATIEEKISSATSISVGDVRVGFPSSSSSTSTSGGGTVSTISGEDGLNATVYGQRFLELQRRNTANSFSFLRA